VKDIPWKEAVALNKKMEEKIEKEFMKNFGMLDIDGEDEDYDDMFASMFGKKGKSGASMENMFMEMMLGGMPSMSKGSTKRKNNKK
jgi:hypothetical protein